MRDASVSIYDDVAPKVAGKLGNDPARALCCVTVGTAQTAGDEPTWQRQREKVADLGGGARTRDEGRPSWSSSTPSGEQRSRHRSARTYMVEDAARRH